MSEQIAVRIPEEDLEGLDRLVAAGHYPSRAAALRSGIDLILRLGRERAIAEEYRTGYGTDPQEQWVGAAGLVAGAQLIALELAAEGHRAS